MKNIRLLPNDFMIMVHCVPYDRRHLWLVRVKDWNNGARVHNITLYPHNYLGLYSDESTASAREKAIKILDKGKFQIQCLAFDMK